MKRILISLMIGVALMTGMVAQPVWAAGDKTLCDEITDEALLEQAGCKLGEGDTADKMANNIIKVVLSLVGVLAVCVMILGGIMYMISTGDAAKVHRAKNIILYGLIGLIISLAAYVIVAFVLDNIG